MPSSTSSFDSDSEFAQRWSTLGLYDYPIDSVSSSISSTSSDFKPLPPSLNPRIHTLQTPNIFAITVHRNPETTLKIVPVHPYNIPNPNGISVYSIWQVSRRAVAYDSYTCTKSPVDESIIANSVLRFALDICGGYAKLPVRDDVDSESELELPGVEDRFNKNKPLPALRKPKSNEFLVETLFEEEGEPEPEPIGSVVVPAGYEFVWWEDERLGREDPESEVVTFEFWRTVGGGRAGARKNKGVSSVWGR